MTSPVSPEPRPPLQQQLRHSALGITALVVSLLGLVLLLIGSGLGLLLVQRHVAAEGLVMAPTLGLLGLVSVGLQCLALLLGLGSLLQAHRRRLPGLVALLLALLLLASHVAAVHWARQHWQAAEAARPVPSPAPAGT